MNDNPTTDGRHDPHVPDRADREPLTPREPASDEISALARHRDPSRPESASSTQTQHAHTGIAWVRPSELLPSAGAQVLGRGIDFQAELARRTRALPAQRIAVSRQAIRQRAQRLPPVSAFGRSSNPKLAPTRTAVGLR